jgi:hypothetical protein
MKFVPGSHLHGPIHHDPSDPCALSPMSAIGRAELLVLPLLLTVVLLTVVVLLLLLPRLLLLTMGRQGRTQRAEPYRTVGRCMG